MAARGIVYRAVDIQLDREPEDMTLTAGTKLGLYEIRLLSLHCSSSLRPQ